MRRQKTSKDCKRLKNIEKEVKRLEKHIKYWNRLQNIARDFEELDFEELQKTENDWKSFQRPSKDKEGSLTFKKTDWRRQHLWNQMTTTFNKIKDWA